MKVHVIFVEPAQYSLDLVNNIYSNASVSFLYSNSKAVDNTSNDSLSNSYYCDKHSFFQNFKHFVTVGFNNKFIVSNGYTHWSFRLLFLISFFKKNYIGIESDTPYSKKKGLKKIIKKLYLKIIFSNQFTLGLSGGNGTHMDLFLKYGMDKHRVFLLPMMIDNQKFFRIIKKQSSSILTFLYVGRLDPEKNVNLLINAFKSKFESNNNSVKLIIVGAGSCEKELKNKSESNKNILFKGKLFGDELIDTYHQADVLVLPSVFEPWGLVVNEALSSGLAIICSNAVGAADDLVIKPDAGWVFNSDDQKELEKLFSYCSEHQEEVKKKAQNGETYMKNIWNYKNYKQNLEEIKNYVRSN